MVCCFVLAVFCAFLRTSTAATTINVTSSVGEIIGYVSQLNVSGQQTTFTRFLGIPYAESTAGVNRFRKPVPKASFAQPFDAVKDGPICVQANKGSEDCLHLNVFVPGTVNRTTSLPVMIWIHGGGFVTGSTHPYHPEVLCTRGNVIVVSINYRLGELGFMSTGNNESLGNYGLWDQHLAFKWVNTNIRAFGGDPSDVTIFGESAGGASCLLQALYPGNSGLFKRVIAESGTALNNWSFTKKHTGAQILRANNCSTVDCLRTKTAAELQTVQSHSHIHGFQPSIDHEFLHETPTAILEKNNMISAQARAFFSSLDVMTGVNSMEGLIAMTGQWKTTLHLSYAQHFAVTNYQFDHVVLPSIVNAAFGNSLSSGVKHRLTSAISSFYLNATERADPLLIRDKLLKLSSDVSFFLPAVRTVKSHFRLSTNTGSSTYLYEFTQNPTHRRNAYKPHWVHGPSHTEEIQFVLGRTLLQNDAPDSEKDLSSAVMTMWTNFAKTGNPNVPVDVTNFTHCAWPKYDLTSQEYLDLSASMSPSSVRDHFQSDMEKFWLHTLPSLLYSSHPDPAIIG